MINLADRVADEIFCRQQCAASSLLPVYYAAQGSSTFAPAPTRTGTGHRHMYPRTAAVSYFSLSLASHVRGYEYARVQSRGD